MPRRNSSTPRRNSTSSKSSKTSKESSKQEETVSSTVVEETRVVNEQDSEIRQSRVQEKHQLHNLNDRLQNFVLHSKAMEEENADLRRQLRDMEERMKESLQEVHQEYSKQSKKLRTSVTTMTAKNNGLESENARLLAEVHALNKKIQQTDSLREENHKLSDQVRDLSDELRKYKAKVSQNEEEIERLREIIANHEEVIATREDQLQEATKELETVQKTIKKGARHSDGELAERVRGSLTEAHKKWQRETQTALQKLETDLRQHFKHTTVELNERSETLVRQNERLRKENERLANELDNNAGGQQDLLNKLAEQERQHKHVVTQLQRDLMKREEELTKAASSLVDKNNEFNDLMDVKISLQTEIEKYRSILDVEEARINTPTQDRHRPSKFEKAQDEAKNNDEEEETTITTKKARKTVKRSRSTQEIAPEGKKGKGKGKGKNKRRRLKNKKDSEEERSTTRLTTRAKTGPLHISDVDLISDCVSVANETSAPVPMKGWTLISETGNQVFNFPDALVLKPGDRVTVWSGAHAESHHAPPDNLFWTRRYVWNNHGDTAILVNPAGEHVSIVSGVPSAMSAASDATPASSVTRGTGASVNGGDDQNCVIM